MPVNHQGEPAHYRSSIPAGRPPVMPSVNLDYTDHETMLRRWAIEQAKALSTVDTAEELVDAAKAIEAYVKGSE